MRMPCFPNGKRFALSIFDDTDNSSVSNVKPVYDLLSSLGIRITKSVWSIAPREQSYIGGDTLAVPEYLSFVQQLRDKGFEIGFHNATSHDCLVEAGNPGQWADVLLKMLSDNDRLEAISTMTRTDYLEKFSGELQQDGLDEFCRGLIGGRRTS